MKKKLTLTKKSAITLTTLSGIVALVGAGTLGGTYDSYSNYQLLTNMQKIINNDPWLQDSKNLGDLTTQITTQIENEAKNDKNLSKLYYNTSDSDGTPKSSYIFSITYNNFSISDFSPSGWNSKYWGLNNNKAWDDNYKETQNSYLNGLKNIFQYQTMFPSYESYKNFFMKNFSSGNPSPQELLDLQLRSLETYNLYNSLYSLNYEFDANQGGVIAGSVVLIVGAIAFIIMLVFILEEKKKKDKEAKKLEETIETSNM